MSVRETAPERRDAKVEEMVPRKSSRLQARLPASGFAHVDAGEKTSSYVASDAFQQPSQPSPAASPRMGPGHPPTKPWLGPASLSSTAGSGCAVISDSPFVVHAERTAAPVSTPVPTVSLRRTPSGHFWSSGALQLKGMALDYFSDRPKRAALELCDRGLEPEPKLR
eukprot:CAMPEP_0194516970 /NCGR_PEP_ID=MMETSP0253-20130528/50017_1 /TAXON_ID=2966 /ORGANISM="Noctiluca scintillans" /LENGTH=166 /DNA_ID=CAMNT_0039360885 /DNA_START=129 /DNA_END=626 /DNA_ORIENTATION=+